MRACVQTGACGPMGACDQWGPVTNEGLCTYPTHYCVLSLLRLSELSTVLECWPMKPEVKGSVLA